MSLISAAVPVTTNSMLFKLWNAMELVAHVDISVLSKLDPDIAPIYSSQLSCIFSTDASVDTMLPIYSLWAITEEFVLVIKSLIFSAVSETVTPVGKLSVIKPWDVKASVSANNMKSSTEKDLFKKLEESTRVEEDFVLNVSS